MSGMKISLDAAMRARDVSPARTADDRPADNPTTNDATGAAGNPTADDRTAEDPTGPADDFIST
jgi:hypothetical protein